MERVSCPSMDDMLSEFQRWEDSIRKFLISLKACSVLIICIIGIVISLAINGAPFYRLLDTTEGRGMVYGGRGIEPYCRAILYEAHFPLQMKVVEFSMGGGTIYDAGQISGSLDIDASLSEGIRLDIDGIRYQNYSVLEKDECRNLAIMPSQRGTNVETFHFVDAEENKNLTLRSECGGGDGVWEVGEGGVEAVPLMTCLVGWLVLRMEGCFFDWKRWGVSGSWLSWSGTQVCKYLILTVGANVAIAPILNMHQTDGCEQLLTSLYSFRMQSAVMAGLFPLTLAVLRVVWLVQTEDDNPETKDVELDLVKRSKSAFLKCLGFEESDAPCWRNWLHALVPTILILASAVLLVLQLWTVLSLSWEFSWGFLFDWHLKWPKIQLTGELTIFHVLAQFLWFQDMIAVVMDGLSKAKTVLEAAKNAVGGALGVA